MTDRNHSGNRLLNWNVKSVFFSIQWQKLRPWHLPTFFKISLWFYFFVFGLDLNNSSGYRPSTRPELGWGNTEESKLKNWCLTGLWNDLKWPQVTSDSFKGQIKWLKIRRHIISIRLSTMRLITILCGILNNGFAPRTLKISKNRTEAEAGEGGPSPSRKLWSILHKVLVPLPFCVKMIQRTILLSSIQTVLIHYLWNELSSVKNLLGINLSDIESEFMICSQTVWLIYSKIIAILINNTLEVLLYLKHKTTSSSKFSWVHRWARFGPKLVRWTNQTGLSAEMSGP